MAILTELTEEEATSSAAAAAEYAVFLSFRGEDTRFSFTDHLYQALLDADIPTFLDEEEVETGEDLKPELARAIRTSRASIIVLSQNYASSRWCLDELVMILEQRRTSNHFVLPIFYNVDPSRVRKQEGSFGDALGEHKRKLEAEKDPEKRRQGARKLDSWTKGLAEVADLKGKNATGRRETVFIEEIVKEISSKLELHLQSKVPDLIGIDHSISFIDSWLKEGPSETADILTIWGMAGIGKTTLARYIYMLHYHEFERYCFLEGIEREYAKQSSALLDLQKRLLEDIRLKKKSKIEVRDVNECIDKIENALLNRHALVVLDDVDSVEQLKMLIGTKRFHHGSKIIITTKDMSLTEKYCELFRTSFPPKHTKHELSCLSDAESLRLFYRHAFGGSVPKEGYEEEARKFAKYCGGHPLALEVLGSSLLGKDVAKWRDVFEMLKTKELLAIKRIQNILRVTFDCLSSENCQELFKHIACFFVGDDREVTESILNECGIRVSYGIAELIDRCLLTIGSRNELKMHQLLQEMGRDLVYQESRDKPGKRSRIWNHEESLKLLKDDKGTKKIQGLFLDMKMLEKQRARGSSSTTEPKFRGDLVLDMKIELRTSVLKKMDGLNLLQLNHVKLNGSYKNFPNGLRLLCMHGFRLEYIPSELPMENLVALDMSYSDLKQLWKKPKLLGSLKILNLSYCKLVSVGGFSKLPALEMLILKGCASLILVSESIGECDRLVSLDMSYCRKLKNIPSSMGKLKKLESLSIDGCVGAREFLIKMKDIESLTAESISIKTHASSSSIIKLLPRSPKSFLLSLPPSLVSLSLVENNLFNESFPMDFSSLSMLAHLSLNDNPIDSLPDCVRSLGRLKCLCLDRCHRLKSILFPPNTLDKLFIVDCLSLEKVILHDEMPQRPYIDYEHVESLNEVYGSFKIQDLAQTDKEILSSLGWSNLEYVKDHEVLIKDAYRWRGVKKLPVQMYYEFGIFSTCFPGKEVPNWFAHRSKGSSISFTIPSSPTNKRVQGLNICFVHAFSGTGVISFLGTKVSNVTKNRTWIYYGFICVVQEADEDMVWLSHWMNNNEEIEAGDEVNVTILEKEEFGGNLMVRECAINPMYDDGDTEEDPLGYYKSWKNIIGGDLSQFELISGDYFLIHDRFLYVEHARQEIFQHKSTKSLVGYNPKYKYIYPDGFSFIDTQCGFLERYCHVGVLDEQREDQQCVDEQCEDEQCEDQQCEDEQCEVRRILENQDLYQEAMVQKCGEDLSYHPTVDEDLQEQATKGRKKRRLNNFEAAKPTSPAKFCDECGAEYLRETSKFCSQCRAKRLGT